jgi:hypothetical protein
MWIDELLHGPTPKNHFLGASHFSTIHRTKGPSYNHLALFLAKYSIFTCLLYESKYRIIEFKRIRESGVELVETAKTHISVAWFKRNLFI